ncbi:MAG: DUF3536 domain-containing protein [Elusimicrobia bacterium]|nr:DUF3536 domain-containing protein [Elusimicrobiota bacterium]
MGPLETISQASSMRYLCVHGHFYQPPRENPWLEDIEVQDSAHPYHDWNQRITRECYAPNAASRVLDVRGRITDIVDNYRKISFNFGPTLLSWMERGAPEVYARLLEGDRASVRARGGHGNALAQVYNHIIMPLASQRDKETQVAWGLADFEHRFGRKAEGLWLSETAVDSATLETLAARGIKFTILSPTQARRVRPLRRAADKEGAPAGDWHDVTGGRIDPSRPYLWRSPKGASIALFFYDSPISHAVAFEGLLNNGDVFADRLLSGFSPQRDGAQLMHIATDGESYGHHHRFGDMALAFALQRIENSRSAVLTNYGQFLEVAPPQWEVEIHENSSWSCAHGVERWRSDCGCRLGHHAGWTQAWRAPLRNALNAAAEGIDRVFEKHGARYFQDPWAARNAAVALTWNHRLNGVAEFFDSQARPGLTEEERRDALRLLEMERQRLLMFTSCAWFFDEISGLESTTVLTSAARALELAAAYPEGLGLEKAFLDTLATAKSNIPEMANGAVVYERFVKPVQAGPLRVAAHQAMKTLWRAEETRGRVYCFDFEFLEQRTERTAGTALSLGRIRVESRITRETLDAAYAVLHLGGHDFHCVLKSSPDPTTWRAAQNQIWDRYASGTLTEVLHLFSEHYDANVYDLQDLLLEDRRRILGAVIEDILGRFEGISRLLVDENKKLMNYLLKSAFPMPHAFRLALEAVLGRDMHRAMVLHEKDEGETAGLVSVYDEAKRFGIQLNWAHAAWLVQKRLESHIGALMTQPGSDRAEKSLNLLALADRLELPVYLWEVENNFLSLWKARLREWVRENPTTTENRSFERLAARLRMTID